jgi:hypothetical protein
MRCNNDFKFMPRGFPDTGALLDAFRCSTHQLAACFQKLKAAKKYASVARMAITIVAIHVVANIVDYYITKYAAKPMEQLQNLTTQYALGMRRKEERDGIPQPTHSEDDLKKRSWRVLVTLQNAANRAKMISSTECALFVHTEQQHWTSHNEVPLFISRPVYMASECQRMLSGSKHTLTKPASSVDLSVLGFRRAASVGVVPQFDKAQEDHNGPHSIPNIGNTCFMNALLQCCRQLLFRVPSHLLPQSQQCPLARALQPEPFSQSDVKQWPC